MAIIGRERRLYINGVMLPCTKSLDISFEQPVNELRVKERYNATTEGIQRDQIDEQSCTINISGVVMDDYSNLDTLLDILQSKSEANIELRYKDEVGAKNLKFVGLIDAYSDDSEGIVEFNGTIQSTGNIIKGTVIAPPIFTFTTQKVGEINIVTSGNNTFKDGDGNTLTMPYNRLDTDSDIILMYGDALNTLTFIDAVNCQLIGDYDFSAFTSLQNSNLEGNAFNSLTYIDGQFNTGTLNVINSLAEGDIFSAFILAFDTVMVTSRVSNLQIGTVNNPALLEAGTPEYNAIQSLISKSWNVTVTANRLFTATIEGTKTITPTATFSGVGSVLYQLNGVTVSSVSNSNSDANSFNVQSGDTLTCYYANNTNDIVGLESVICNDCSIQYIYLEQLINESTITLFAQRNLYTTTSINILKSYLDLDTVNGDDYTSLITIDISCLQIFSIYNNDNALYKQNIIDYDNADRLVSFNIKAEKSPSYVNSDPSYYIEEGNFILVVAKSNGVFSGFNGSIINEFVCYGNVYGDYRNFQINNNPNLKNVRLLGGNLTGLLFCNLAQQIDNLELGSDFNFNTSNMQFRLSNVQNLTGSFSGNITDTFRFDVNSSLQKVNNILDLSLLNGSSTFFSVSDNGNCSGGILLGNLTLGGTGSNQPDFSNNNLTGSEDWSSVIFTNGLNILNNPNLIEVIVNDASTINVNEISANQSILTIRKQDGTIIYQIP